MYNSPTPIPCAVCARTPSVKSESVHASTYWHVSCECGRSTAKGLFVSAPVAVMAWNRGSVAAAGLKLPAPIHYYRVPLTK